MIYSTCWPFTENQDTWRYRWQFEKPDTDHVIEDEIVMEYNGDTLIVLLCQSPEVQYYAILGKYLSDENKIEGFRLIGKAKMDFISKIKNKLPLHIVIDL